LNSHDNNPDKDNSRQRRVNADPATILERIKNSNYDHNLVIYPSLAQFEQFYIECYKDSVLDKNEIFIIVTFYQHMSAVRKKIYLLAGDKVAKYENGDMLVILDSQMAYQPSVEQPGRYNITTILTNLLMKHAQERDKKGITLLSDLGTFFFSKRVSDLISYELSVPSGVHSNIRFFCCYHKDDFNALREEQRKRILRHHVNNLILA
jgi:hypothetical protein